MIAPFFTTCWTAVVALGSKLLMLGSGLSVHATELPSAGHHIHRAGLTIAEYRGSPAAIGAAEGTLFAPRIRSLASLMRWQPGLLLRGRSTRFRATLNAISVDDRDRIVACADASGVDREVLLRGNAVVDAQCSALVASADGARPLMVARNMDFFPADVLGPATVVSVIRPDHGRTHVVIGWPGSASVISGMNDAGLVVSVLLQHHGERLPGAEPLGLRLRNVLEKSGSIDEAIAQLRAAPVASSHYVLLADATTTAVVWYDRDGLHRDDPQNGFLAASNGPRRAGQPNDRRGRCLVHRARHAPATIDDTWLRQALTASYMPGINAQAMLFIPATRTLQLAIGTAWHPAATGAWKALQLGPILDGAGLDTLIVNALPSLPKAHHYPANWPFPPH